MADLNQIFTELKQAIAAYCPPLTARTDTERYFDLWSEKPVVIEGRKRKEVFFAAAIIQKDFVGFYFMPVYAENEIKKMFAPELLKLLKGKSCFHIKKLDEALLAQIKDALKVGIAYYQERGWV